MVRESTMTREPRTRERAVERVRRFLDGWTALGSTTHPEVITSVFVRKEDGPRELLVSDLRAALAIEDEAWNAALRAFEEDVRELEFDNERDGQPSSGVYQDLLSRLAALRKGASE